MANRVLDAFASGIGAPWHYHTDIDGTYGSISRLSADGGITPPNGYAYMLKVQGDSYVGGSPLYDNYVYYEADNVELGVQGSRFANTQFVDSASYVAGEGKCLEFWMYPNQTYGSPVEYAGTGGYTRGYLSLGDYTMSETGHSDKAYNGWHTYHSWLSSVDSNGNWFKLKTRHGSGFVSGSWMPAMRCVRNTTNGTPFTAGETITCSPSGATMIYANEFVHDGTNCIFGFPTVFNTNPAAGDTLTGGTSGAIRTISSVLAYVPGSYSGDAQKLHPAGEWAGWSADWARRGGMTFEWYSDWPTTAPLGDRWSRFYIGSVSGSHPLPSANYYAGFVMVDDARDNTDYTAQIGAYYDNSLEKLYVTFTRNLGMTGNAKIAYSYTDIHTTGFAAATLLKTLACGTDYAYTAIYETLTGTASRNLYVAVKHADQADDKFMQIMIPTNQGITVGGRGRMRFRRN